MYAITGITGKVGGELARTLLAAGEPVRAIVRDARKAEEWAALGCEVAVAAMEDADALARAFNDATAVFVLPPPMFDPEPGYPEARAAIDGVVTALAATRPQRVLCLSTIGANAEHDNLLSQRGLMEAALRELQTPLTILRPAWFIDNAAWDVASARDSGVIHSFLMPTNQSFPMVAAQDVGRIAAELIQHETSGTRIVELEGPVRISPDDLASAFAQILGRPVRASVVPRDTWKELFLSQGMKNPGPRMRMLDGFNEGWIEFENRGANAIKGMTAARDVIASLLSRIE